MSEKKNSPKEERYEDPSGIKIVIVGVKNASMEVKISEPAINVIPPVDLQNSDKKE